MVKALFNSLVFLFLYHTQCYALDFSVMTFNTMCDFCHKNSDDSFSSRKNSLRQVIKEHSADLIALQEVRTGEQVHTLLEGLKDYQVFYTDSFLMSYADPAIAVNTKKFQVLEQGQFWLGPRDGKFSFGWKFALPRQALWVKLKSLSDGQELVFITSHFDNRVENLLGSAQMLNRFTQEQKLPIVFAADTNCVPDFKGYTQLLGTNLINAFDIKEKFSAKGKSQKDEDFCYSRKGDEFPACRVDHVLLSKQHPWKVREWLIDARRLGEKERFPSDHRAIINQLTL